MKKRLSTTKPKNEVPDSELYCHFCRKNDRQEDMTVTTGRSSSGLKLRRVYHRRCQREYRKELRKRNENLAYPVKFHIEFENDMKPLIFKPKDTLLQKLIDNIKC